MNELNGLESFGVNTALVILLLQGVVTLLATPRRLGLTLSPL